MTNIAHNEVWHATACGVLAIGRTAHHAATELRATLRRTSHVDEYGSRWHALPVRLAGGPKRATFALATHTSGLHTTIATATRVA